MGEAEFGGEPLRSEIILTMFNNHRKPQTVGEILKSFDPVKDKYISREFQKYGYDLAEELGDLSRKALYIKLAKETPRIILEKARCFVKDANARSKARLFMWKLKELRTNPQKFQNK